MYICHICVYVSIYIYKYIYDKEVCIHPKLKQAFRRWCQSCMFFHHAILHPCHTCPPFIGVGGWENNMVGPGLQPKWHTQPWPHPAHQNLSYRKCAIFFHDKEVCIHPKLKQAFRRWCQSCMFFHHAILHPCHTCPRCPAQGPCIFDRSLR